MTTFYFIRHGAVFQGPNLTDPPLSLLGWQQAHATAAYLQQKPIKRVFTSPLQRAKETALHIATLLQLEMVEDARLRERINWGDLPGQSFAEFVTLWDLTSRDRHYLPPAGDSAYQAGARLEDFIQTTQQQYPHDEVVAVAHGGLIADFLLNVFSVEQLNQVNVAFSGHPYSGNVMQNCSMTLIHYHGDHYHLEKIASVEHLNGLVKH